MSVNVSNSVTDIQRGLEYDYIVSQCLCMFYLRWGETRVLLCHLIHLLHCLSPDSKPPVARTHYPSVHLSVKSSLKKGTILGQSKRFQVMHDSWRIATTADVTVEGSSQPEKNFWHQQVQSTGSHLNTHFVGLRHSSLKTITWIYNNSCVPLFSSQSISKYTINSNSDVNTIGGGRLWSCWAWQTHYGRHLSGCRFQWTIPAWPGPAPPHPPWGGAAWRCGEQRSLQASAWRTDPWSIQALA